MINSLHYNLQKIFLAGYSSQLYHWQNLIITKKPVLSVIVGKVSLSDVNMQKSDCFRIWIMQLI